MKHFLLAIVIISAASLGAAAETYADTTTIVAHITAVNGNVVIQPEALLQRLAPAEIVEQETRQDDVLKDKPVNGRMAGYRVQVFSDNNPRTAKSSAQSKKRTVSARFPQYQSYVMYTSPYWRLKVGDFRTRQEADAAAEELRKAFPAYSNEIRVVRDRVNVQ